MERLSQTNGLGHGERALGHRPEPTAHDVRFGGRWRATQRLKNDAIYALLCGGDAIARRLSPGDVAAGLQGLARDYVLGSRVARDNVAQVFADWPRAARDELLATHAHELARHAHDALRCAWGQTPSAPLQLDPDSAAVLGAAIARGRGVLLASAHLGAWERVASTLVERGVHFAAVSRSPYDPRLERWLAALRRNVPCIPRDRPGAARAMLRQLREGGVLGVPMDLATRGVETVRVPFLGRPTEVVSGPARLAERSGAELVLGTYARRDDGSEWLQITTVARARELATQTRWLADALTHAILDQPTQWLWCHRRWRSPADLSL